MEIIAISTRTNWDFDWNGTTSKFISVVGSDNILCDKLGLNRVIKFISHYWLECWFDKILLQPNTRPSLVGHEVFFDDTVGDIAQQARNDVKMTSFWRNNDVIITPYIQGVVVFRNW